jgi:hypothetical protein
MMKNKKLIIAFIFSFVFSMSNFAQTDPPDPPGTHGSDEDQQGRAPIGGGVFILLGLGVGYGSKKLYDMRKEATLKD